MVVQVVERAFLLLNDLYIKYTRYASDYQSFYEYYFPDWRKVENYILITDYATTYEFDNETLSAIENYNKFVKILNESKTTELEKSILIPKICEYRSIIERYCNYSCLKHINFGSHKRRKKAKEIYKQLEKLLTE